MGMPVIPHECPAEEVKGSATNGRGNRDTLSRDARVHSGCPIWHATCLLSLADLHTGLGSPAQIV